MEFTRWIAHGTASSERGDRAAEGDNILCCPRINIVGSDVTISVSSEDVLQSANETVSKVAVKLDSMESQGVETQERFKSTQLPSQSPSPSLSPVPPPSSSPSALSFPSCSPSSSPFLPSPAPPSPLSLPSTPSFLLPPPPPSPRFPSRSGSLRRPRVPSAISLTDPADQEVYNITSAARCRWKDEDGGEPESRRKAGRSHSLSPYTLPCSLSLTFSSSSPPSTLPPSSAMSTHSLLEEGLKDVGKGFRVDNHGFLEKPPSGPAGYCDDQRRHSIEVCLPQTLSHHLSPESVKTFPVRVQSVGSSHRKKKTSPPCISIHPPSEREHPRLPSPPKLADCNTMLRRRTPSSDLMPQSKDVPVDICTQVPTPLTPIHIPLPLNSLTHTSTPSLTRTLPLASAPSNIPISPNVFIQPHAPLLPTVMHFSQTHPVSSAARHTPLAGDCIPLPRFTFEEPQSRYVSGMSAGPSDPDPATCSSPFDSRLGSSAGFSAKNRRTAQ